MVSPAEQGDACAHSRGEQDADVQAGYGEQMRRAAATEGIAQFGRDVVADAEQHRLGERRLWLRDHDGGGRGEPVAQRVEAAIERAAAALVHKRDALRVHHAADALPREVGGVVEVGQRGRRLDAPGDLQAVAVAEVGRIALPRYGG